MLALNLSISPGNWRLFNARRADPAFQKFSEKVLTRDDYSCQFCGFQAREYQEVVNKDSDYSNNKLNNLVTACCFCAQCLFLEAVGKSDYGGGSLIYLPEMTQTELNGLCHVLFCAISNATSYRSDAQSIYRDLKLRSQKVEEVLGDGLSSPALFGQIMMEANVENRDEKIATILKDVRLLPSRTRFVQQIEAWAAAALDELSTE